MHQIRFRLGLRGPSDLLAVFLGPSPYFEGEGRTGRGKEGEKGERQGRGQEREAEGKVDKPIPQFTFLAVPLPLICFFFHFLSDRYGRTYVTGFRLSSLCCPWCMYCG